MAITVNLRYTGKDGAARKFAEEMTASGTVAAIRAEAGNLRYEYYLPLDDPETVLLIDSWEDQAAIDAHHATPMMATIASLISVPLSGLPGSLNGSSPVFLSTDALISFWKYRKFWNETARWKEPFTAI